MKIVCVGCSYTDGWVDGIMSYKDTYPYKLLQYFPNATVYNLGIGGGSNYLTYRFMDQAIDYYKPDIVVRQITTQNRFFAYNMEKKLENKALVKHAVEKPGENYYLINRNTFKKDCQIFTLSTIGKGRLYNSSTSEKIHKMFFKYIHPDIFYEQDKAFLLAGDAVLNNFKGRHVTFSWFERDRHLNNPCIEDTIKFKNEYVLDEGYHFTPAGNEVLAKNVYDMITEKYKE